jgi:hypothetical protein
MCLSDTLAFLQPIANDIINRWSSEGITSLSEAEQTFLFVWGFGGQVDNGGLEQFFFNSTGEFAVETVNALREVGAARSAAILATAISLFGPSGVPGDLERRNDALEAFSDDAAFRMTELTEQYFDDNERQDELLIQYVLANKRSFRMAG